VCVCVCVTETESERERESMRDSVCVRARKRELERDRIYITKEGGQNSISAALRRHVLVGAVCVSVCVCGRERVRGRTHVCVCARVCERKRARMKENMLQKKEI